MASTPGLGRTTEEENIIPDDTDEASTAGCPTLWVGGNLGKAEQHFWMLGWVLWECRWAGSGQAARSAHLCLIAGEDGAFLPAFGA